MSQDFKECKREINAKTWSACYYSEQKKREIRQRYKKYFASTFDMYFINYLISCENNGLNVY